MSKVSQDEQLYDLAQPDPSALIESLRAFGYSLRTAVADLIDNSIAAGSRNVWVQFEWRGADSYISIKDDGHGMTETELLEAMRPGGRSPLQERDPKDLGRFSLGLKTASFSQCRKLTVISKRGKGVLAARCWDLDYVCKTKEWRLLKINPQDIFEGNNQNLGNQGTVVLWQKMDNVTGLASANDDKAYIRFLEAAKLVRHHLEMVFHRFMEKPGGLKLWMNGLPVVHWDPFCRSEKATQHLPPEKIHLHGRELTVTPYVLPHKSKFENEEGHRRASGMNGWNAQQGFYVYRNERLLVSGEWMGLGFQKEEHYKLARIQVDLPNSLDMEWQIDVKKSRAKPPGNLRQRLKEIAEITRERAKQVYRHRGKVMARQNAQEFEFLWELKVNHGKHFHHVNRNHPLVRQALSTTGGKNVEALLTMLEETIPAMYISIKQAEEPDSLGSPFENLTFETVYPVMTSLYEALIRDGLTHRAAMDKLTIMDPFDSRPEFVQLFIDRFNGE